MAGKSKTMTTSPLSVVIQHHLADLRPDWDGMTDGELLARFLGSRDEDALAALVRRHASMVWGVCCRLLNLHDAEDAFQATFLVLVRKASNVPSQAVANWLYGVARQTAVRLRATAARQGRREKQVANMPEPTMPEVRDADLHSVVDEELSRLPDHYRGVILLCDLEGMTRKEAARQLGIPEGSVASRLARARTMLARRLSLRGLLGSAGTVLSAVSAPPTLVASTIKAANLLAAGQAAGVVSAKVAAITEGMVKAMFVTKIKSVLAVVLVVGLALAGIEVGIGLSTNPAAMAQQPNVQPNGNPKPLLATAEPMSDMQKLQGDWQAVELERAGEKASAEKSKQYSMIFKGNVITTNVDQGRSEFKIDPDKSPKQIDITALDGPLDGRTFAGIYSLDKDTLKICLPDGVVNAPDQRPHEFKTTEGSGRVLFNLHRKTAVGQDDKKPTVEPAMKQKEKVTAWGKEVDGMQVGIQFREDRVYKIGESVTLIVRLRNKGQKDVPFRDEAEYFQKNPPLITDTDNKAFKIKERSIFGVIRARSIAPGKEVDLMNLQLALRPVTDREKDAEWTLYGTGKFYIQYKDLPVVGEVRLGTPGMTLTTGKLELDVKEGDDKKPTIENPNKKPMAVAENAKPEKKKVYTPDEVMLVEEKARGRANDGKAKIVTVEFKVQAVTKPTEIKLTTEKDSPWVVGHGPDDLSLHPQPPKKFEERQFTVILTPTVVKQLNRVGIQDVGKHFAGKTIRVSGQVRQHNYSGDDPPIETHYDLVVEDVSQFETVD
jgi:RNA polymerase sigma factor (sigma-70 family)